jgi:hypothetical protein
MGHRVCLSTTLAMRSWSLLSCRHSRPQLLPMSSWNIWCSNWVCGEFLFCQFHNLVSCPLRTAPYALQDPSALAAKVMFRVSASQATSVQRAQVLRISIRVLQALSIQAMVHRMLTNAFLACRVIFARRGSPHQVPVLPGLLWTVVLLNLFSLHSL